MLGFVVAGYFFWVPKYREFKSNNAQINVEGEKVKLKKDYLFELESKLSALSDYEEILSKINSALPMEFSADALFSFVQKKASENGLIITEVDLSEASSRNVIQEEGIVIDKIGITVTVTGKYSSFKDFLLSVYKNSRLIEVKSITFDHNKEESESLDVFDFKLELEASYYKRDSF